jgi:outer membrane lipoprotein-sorting protein
MPPARVTDRARRRRKIWLGAIASLLLPVTFQISGCIEVQQPPIQIGPSPTPGFSEDQVQASRMIAALIERDRRLVSMQTTAVMEYSAGNQHVKAKEEITVKRASNLRVEAMSPLGVALLLVAQGADLSIFEPSQNRFMRGQANADTLYRYVRIPMEPTDAVGLLMALAPPTIPLSSNAYAVTKDGAMLIASYGNTQTGMHQLGFVDGNLAMVRESASGGAVEYEVRYSDYHDIGGLMFPYVVDATFPAAGSHVTFRYLRPIVNSVIPDSTFVLTPAPGANVTNMSFDDDAHYFSNNG